MERYGIAVTSESEWKVLIHEAKNSQKVIPDTNP